MGVEVLVPQMQETLSQIRATIESLSAKEHSERLDELERKRERLLAELRDTFESERRELEKRRQAELDGIVKKRKQEDEEREARRRKEDEELKKTNTNEDKKRQQKFEDDADTLEDETEQQLDEIESLARKMIEEGKQKLQELEERRRVSKAENAFISPQNTDGSISQELNRRMDEQMQQLPSAPVRRRVRSKRRSVTSSKDSMGSETASPSSQERDSTIQNGHSTVQDGKSYADKAAPDTEAKTPAPKDTEKKEKKEKKDKKQKRPDTPSKPQPTLAEKSPSKAPEAKQNGELPFQDRSNGHAQAAKRSTNDLPMSFAEAVKKYLSNQSKEKPERGTARLNQVKLSKRRNDGGYIPSSSLIW